MGLFGRKPKVEGLIGYFRLGDWWLSTFTEKERNSIEAAYGPLDAHPRPLTQGKISTNQTAVGLLGRLADWFKKPEDFYLARRILLKMEELIPSCQGILDQHFAYQVMVEVFYRNRETDPTGLDSAIVACEKQIRIAPNAARAFKREFKDSQLPAHVGYRQLAIIREKQGDLAAAIRLSNEATRQGWDGDWEKRIARSRKKMAKLGVSTRKMGER